MESHAYVLINVEPARTQRVIAHLRTIPGATVREVLGPYDIIMELEAEAPEYVTAILREKIRPVAGITSTVTCPWIEEGGAAPSKAWE